jgi:hypothetical protein
MKALSEKTGVHLGLVCLLVAGLYVVMNDYVRRIAMIETKVEAQGHADDAIGERANQVLREISEIKVSVAEIQGELKLLTRRFPHSSAADFPESLFKTRQVSSQVGIFPERNASQ